MNAPLCLIGPNGSGKTSILKLIAGALRPDRGRIRLGQTELFDCASGVDVPSERRRVGYVPQGYGLFPHLSALDNVAFGLSTSAHGKRRSDARAEAERLLEQLDCTALASRLPIALSGGERQRIALARALLVEPELLLLDEPLSALDVGARRSVRSFLAARLRSLHKPALVVTHDPRDVKELDAEVCVVERGRVVQRGSLDALRADPKSDFVAEFVAL
jgi:ABC-type sulfate/molybdate transport systems ATPase subunit